MTEENQMEGTEKGGKDNKKSTYTIIAVVVLAVVVLGLFFISSKNENKTASISGTINFNGLKPQDDKEQKIEGKLTLMQRESGQESFQNTKAKIDFKDGANWVWHEAQSGKTYEIKVDLSLDGEFIKSSNIITVTAPASEQTLALEITLKDIPEHILAETNVLVSGTFDINGYVPDGSTIAIYQKLKESDANSYQEADKNILASDNKSWSWDGATPGKEYDLKATMYYKDKIIGESQEIDLVAPASDEILKIQSRAKNPATEIPATISGKVKVSGPVNDSTTINLYQKKVNDKDYQKFDNIPAINGSTFKWTKAIQGTQYQIMATLNVAGEDTSHSNIVTVTAPAKNEVLKLDTNISLKSPEDKPKVDCGKKDDTGHWNATLTFHRINKANTYSMELGSKPGKNDVKQEERDQTKKNNPTMEIYVKDGIKYYVRYAYSPCSNCDLDDKQNWSGYSPTLGFVCSDDEENSDK